MSKELHRQLKADTKAIGKVSDLLKEYDSNKIDLGELYTQLKGVFTFDLPMPVLAGIITRQHRKDWEIKVYCPYCKDWHYHGIPVNESYEEFGEILIRGEQHKSSHCSNKFSPFNTGGYLIHPYTKAELEEIGNDVRNA